MNNKETLAQRFNEILKAYGVLFSDDAMRSRLIIDLMSEVTQVTRQHPPSNKLIHQLAESLPEELQPLYCTMSPVPMGEIRSMLIVAFNDIANDQYAQAYEFIDRTYRAAFPQGAPAELARRFHEAYERLAPKFSYETRKASAKPWAEVPENNRNLMIAVCAEILGEVTGGTLTVTE